MKRLWYISILTGLAALLFLDGAIVHFKFRATSAFSDFFSSLIPSRHLYNQIELLNKENILLRAELLSERIYKEGDIKVYSTHPLSHGGEIVIAAGKNQGIKEGDVITDGDSFLVGQVVTALPSSSVVMTILNPNWEMAVRIGDKEVDGLFHGGTNPRVTLIPTETELSFGQVVFTASKELPYGLLIGKIKETHDISGTPFQEATIEPSIRVNTLRNVTIYRER